MIPARARGPLESRTILLALDTGSGYTVLTPNLIEALGYQVTGDNPTTRIATVTEVVTRPRVTVDEVLALGLRRSGLEVVVSALPRGVGFHGLLGLDFLHNSRLTIDFRRGEIELEA